MCQKSAKDFLPRKVPNRKNRKFYSREYFMFYSMSVWLKWHLSTQRIDNKDYLWQWWATESGVWSYLGHSLRWDTWAPPGRSTYHRDTAGSRQPLYGESRCWRYHEDTGSRWHVSFHYHRSILNNQTLHHDNHHNKHPTALWKALP